MKRKTGIFGGTFNPPHLGHVRLAKAAADMLGLDRVLVIPDCVPPHKAEASLADGADRLEMCRLAFSDPVFEVSSIELDRGDKSYTVETLRSLKEMFPEDEFYLIVGSDMLDTFRRWYRWEEILELAHLCGAGRVKDYVFDHSSYTDAQRERIQFIAIDAVEISSTEIRAMLKSNADCSGFIDPKVSEYIYANNIYDDGFDSVRSILREMLDAERLYHCECVSESAAMLAAKYGADIEKARLAGLIHDITKNLPAEKQLELMGDITPLERNNHKVWHQMSAPVFLREEGICTDEEILEAVRWHTTGKAGMTLLSKVIYTADFISAERDYPDVETVRKLADISLEHAILYASRYTINSLVARDISVHPSTLDCYNDTLRHFGL